MLVLLSARNAYLIYWHFIELVIGPSARWRRRKLSTPPVQRCVCVWCSRSAIEECTRSGCKRFGGSVTLARLISMHIEWAQHNKCLGRLCVCAPQQTVPVAIVLQRCAAGVRNLSGEIRALRSCGTCTWSSAEASRFEAWKAQCGTHCFI